MAKSIFIGLDFSINKPAMTILYDKQFSFYIWPLKMSKKQLDLYNNNGVEAVSRGLNEISHNQIDSSKMVIEHTRRSIDLANMIANRIDEFIMENDAYDAALYIASEGLSFNSVGSATLDLATYKGVLLSQLYTRFMEQLRGMYTYASISIKSTAGCAGRKKFKDKNEMIKAFAAEKCDMKFKDGLLSSKFTTKSKNFIKCVDDIVDSYFALKTMLKKETFI